MSNVNLIVAKCGRQHRSIGYLIGVTLLAMATVLTGSKASHAQDAVTGEWVGSVRSPLGFYRKARLSIRDDGRFRMVFDQAAFNTSGHWSLSDNELILEYSGQASLMWGTQICSLSFEDKNDSHMMRWDGCQPKLRQNVWYRRS